jgi:hypothetical protein
MSLQYTALNARLSYLVGDWKVNLDIIEDIIDPAVATHKRKPFARAGAKQHTTVGHCCGLHSLFDEAFAACLKVQ